MRNLDNSPHSKAVPSIPWERISASPELFIDHTIFKLPVPFANPKDLALNPMALYSLYGYFSSISATTPFQFCLADENTSVPEAKIPTIPSANHLNKSGPAQTPSRTQDSAVQSVIMPIMPISNPLDGNSNPSNRTSMPVMPMSTFPLNQSKWHQSVDEASPKEFIIRPLPDLIQPMMPAERSVHCGTRALWMSFKGSAIQGRLVFQTTFQNRRCSGAFHPGWKHQRFSKTNGSHKHGGLWFRRSPTVRSCILGEIWFGLYVEISHAAAVAAWFTTCFSQKKIPALWKN